MNTDTFSLFVALLTVVANVFVLAVVVVALAARRSPALAAKATRWRDLIAHDALTAAWLVAVVCTAGSLYYSEIANFPPCELCWYQRIAMYPLVVVLGIAAWRRDVDVRRYVLPVVAIGSAISIYHYQLERFPEQGSLSCSVSVLCTTVWVWRFHYISLPLMALSGFAAIATLLVLARGRDHDLGDDPAAEADRDLEAVAGR